MYRDTIVRKQHTLFLNYTLKKKINRWSDKGTTLVLRRNAPFLLTHQKKFHFASLIKYITETTFRETRS